ncbi:MAG: imidazole glycerol phosphate synthase subunit HisH, partial [Clostridia bacterium]|nr:imidazole glycerol phosphate synthase subunit HisH [Clostridia bacterium]
AQNGKPLLGICLGMQLLFEKSFEYGEHEGLGLIEGQVVAMQGSIPENLKIPHIGWNALQFKTDSPLFKYINDNDCVYFVHSYYAQNCDSSLIAVTDYGKPLTAAVQKNNIFGCQFHPEKSGNVGLNILKAFCEME